MPTERLKLLVAYDGRSFRGWQSQPTKDSVQDFLEAALKTLCGERIVVHGSGRTDAGVHALGQIAHIDVPKGRLPLKSWLLALNAHLPPEVRVIRVNRAQPDFHARFSAVGKTYQYRLWVGPVLHPLEIGRAWHLPGPLDLERLHDAARVLTGTHDFAAFAANRGRPEPDTVRTIEEIVVRRAGPLITLRFTGTGFLYRMVRLLTGSIVRVAQGKAATEWLSELLAHPSRAKSQFAAPAEGLYLVRVSY